MLLQVLDVLAEPLGITTQHLQWLIVAMVVGLGLTTYLSWMFDLRPEEGGTGGNARWFGASAAFLAICLFAGGIWWVMQPSGTTPESAAATSAKKVSWQQRSYEASLSVAVLDFDNLSMAPGYDNFPVAISQSIRYQLIQEGTYNVVPNELSQRDAIPEEVDRIIDGSIRFTEDTVVVDIEVFDPKSRTRIVTERLNWPLASNEVVHDQLSSYLIRFLNSTLVTGGNFGPATPAAKRLFRDSIQFVSEDASTDRALEVLEEITALEPSWARGWLLKGYYWVNTAAFSSDPEKLKEAELAYEQAQQQGVEPQELALALGYLAWFEGDLDLAERRFAADALDRRDPSQYALIMKAAGLIEESHPVTRKQAHLWPYRVDGWRRLAESCFALKDPDCVLEAEARRKAISLPEQYLIKPEALWAYGRKRNLKALQEVRDDLRARLERVDNGKRSAVIALYDRLVEAQVEIALIEGEVSPDLERGLIGFDRVFALLRLGKDELAQQVADKSLARPPAVTLWHWTENRWRVPDSLSDHPLTQRFTEASGYTNAWRLEVCRRVARQFPPESGLRCDPSKYALEPLQKPMATPRA